MDRLETCFVIRSRSCLRSIEPASEDWAIKLLNQVARSQLLTKHLLLNDGVFFPVRRAVILARAALPKSRVGRVKA